MSGNGSSGYSSRIASTSSHQFQTSAGLFEPLAKVVYDTFTKLVAKNSQDREIKDVCEWASGQIKKVVEQTVLFTTIQIVKEDDEKKRREREAAGQQELKDNIHSLFEELVRENQNQIQEHSVVDHGTRKIKYPWEKNKFLGKGAFGAVHSATDKNDFQFAVKIVDTQGVERNCIEDEIKCLTRLSYEYIVGCYGWAEAGPSVFMYLELLDGSVRDKLDEQKQPLEVAEAKKYTRDILKGLIYLHDRNLIHRDIKSANVLLDKKKKAKLGDMGLVKTHKLETKASMYNNFCGTVLFLSPEVLTQAAEAGKRADVWSVGCTVYEMLKFIPPFYTEDFLALFGGPFQDMQAGVPIHQNLVNDDTELPVLVKSFLQLIFAKLEERPYADGIALHRWLRN